VGLLACAPGPEAGSAEAAGEEQRGIFFHTSSRPWRGADYFIDPVTRIVLTKQRAPRRNGYGVDLRGLEPDHQETGFGWRSEFFCEPDSILIEYNNSVYAKSYLSYLNWIDDVHHTPHEAWISLKHLTGNGSLAAIVPEKVLATHDPTRFDIQEDHHLYGGSFFVASTVTLTNRHSEPLSAIYVYQDAAYLWFPRGNQKGIEPINVRVRSDRPAAEVRTVEGYQVVRLGPEEIAFGGYFDPEHGVLAGVVAVDPGTALGTIRGYISLEAGVRTEHGTFPLVMRDRVHFDDLTAALGIGRVKNRFVAFHVRSIPPNEQARLRFFRFMRYFSDRPVAADDWRDVIAEALVELAGRLGRQKAGKSIPPNSVESR
jgi:hypothetical protein